MPVKRSIPTGSIGSAILFVEFFVSLIMNIKYGALRESLHQQKRGPADIRYRAILSAAILLMAGILSASCDSRAQAPAPADAQSYNSSPVIRYLTASELTFTSQVKPSTGVDVVCMATDREQDTLSYRWSVSGGKIEGNGDTILWIAPENEGNHSITVTVDDGKGGSTTEQLDIRVTDTPSEPPVVTAMRCNTCKDGIEASRWTTYELTCDASDPEDGELSYIWFATTGKIEGSGPTVSWITKGQYGNALITVIVSDEDGNEIKGYLAINISCCH